MSLVNKTTQIHSTSVTTMSISDTDISLVGVNEYTDKIEHIYLEKPIINYWPQIYNSPKVFKYIFTVENGVLKKSDKIYGRYYPSQEWSYEFN